MALTTAYRQQMPFGNPHLSNHVYRIALLTHLGATPWRFTRMDALATRSPAGTDEQGFTVSAAAQLVGAGYTAGGEIVVPTIDVVGETVRLLVTGPSWGAITGIIRGAVLYNATLELGTPSSIMAYWSANEDIDRVAEPLRLTFGTGEVFVLPREA